MVRVVLPFVVVLLSACGGGDDVSVAGPDSGGGDGKTASDGSAGDSAASDTSPVVPLVYSAYHLPGVYDRIQVFGKDVSRNLCFKIQLVNPSGTTGALIIASGWGLEIAEVFNDAAACVSSYTGAAENAMTDSQSGSVSWTGASPTMLDVDVTMQWIQPPVWGPSSEHLKATAVPVN